jgi:AraC-like DNA-binding protein
MIYHETLPHKDLQPYIKCYWTLEHVDPSGSSEGMPPMSCYELVFQLGDLYQIDGVDVPRCFLTGQLDKPLIFSARKIRIWGVRFLPWGLTPFGNVLALHAKNTSDAHKVLTIDVDSLEQQLHASDTTSYAELSDIFFRNYMSTHSSSMTLEHVFAYIQDRKGIVKISELAEYSGKSVRQLERDMYKLTGLIPRELLARIRFENALAAFIADPESSAMEVVAAYGYHDQSHLIKDFNRYMLLPPGAFARGASTFSKQNVAFIQSLSRI